MMIRISISPEAYATIASTLPEGAPRFPVLRGLTHEGIGGGCFVDLEASVVNRLGAMRGRGETYSDVILRLAAPGLDTQAE
jgi:hypothetical protein